MTSPPATSVPFPAASLSLWLKDPLPSKTIHPTPPPPPSKSPSATPPDSASPTASPSKNPTCSQLFLPPPTSHQSPITSHSSSISRSATLRTSAPKNPPPSPAKSSTTNPTPPSTAP